MRSRKRLFLIENDKLFLNLYYDNFMAFYFSFFVGFLFFSVTKNMFLPEKVENIFSYEFMQMFTSILFIASTFGVSVIFFIYNLKRIYWLLVISMFLLTAMLFFAGYFGFLV